MPKTSNRTSVFNESVIRRMTRVANEYGAINLSQGFPDFDPPEALLKAAEHAGRHGPHQYAVTWGAPRFRAALARKQSRCMGMRHRSRRQSGRHLRQHRGDDGGDADGLQSGRQGRRLFAVLRKLRAPTQSSPAPSRSIVPLKPSGLRVRRSIRRSCEKPLSRKSPKGDHPVQSVESLGQGIYPKANS